MATVTHRKLVKFGSGIVVTLPKAWTDYYQLKPGDRIEVEIEGIGTLTNTVVEG